MSKKIISLLSLLMLWSTMFAQQYDAEEIKGVQRLVAQRVGKFLTVKGIELMPNLPVNGMLRYLKKQGLDYDVDFNRLHREYGIYALRGTFYGVRDCSIKIFPISDDSNMVGVVAIDFPDKRSFKQLKSLYDELKIDLEKKYYLYSCDEYFDNPEVETETNDQLKIDALLNGECTFESIFYVSDDSLCLLLGQVKLKITSVTTEDNVHYFYVSLIYTTPDKILELYLNQSSDDL